MSDSCVRSEADRWSLGDSGDIEADALRVAVQDLREEVERLTRERDEAIAEGIAFLAARTNAWIAERDDLRARVSAVCAGANEMWLWHSARHHRLRAVARAVIALDAGGYAMHPELVPLIRALTPGDLEDPT